MKLSQSTPCNHIAIKYPRWKQRVVGVAKFRVGTHNAIEITAVGKDGERYYPDMYYMSGEDIVKHPVQKLPGSGVELYLVPINELEILEREK